MPPEHQRFTVEEYFRREETAADKHEFRDGQIVMMAGGTRFHSLITTNVLVALGNRLNGKSCEVYDSNLRVRVPRRLRYVYPDITVVCGKFEPDPNDPGGGSVLNPKLIVEVLSPSTEGYDRGEKFDGYRQIESLEEYVLISQSSAHVQTFLRQKEGLWLFDASAGIEGTAKLKSLSLEIPLTEIYAGVEFPPAAE